MFECDLEKLAKIFNVTPEKMEKQVESLIEKGLLIKNGDMYRISEMGRKFMKFISKE